MPVYVDDMYTVPMGQFGKMKMSHMIADTTDELLAMADRIGVARKWIQYPGDNLREHFDIAISKRALAIKEGAIPITMQEFAKMMNHRFEHGTCGYDKIADKPAPPAQPDLFG